MAPKSSSKRPNLNQIYQSPLPVNIRPLPPIFLHNPLSVVYYLYEYVFPSKPTPISCQARINSSGLIKVINDKDMELLWRMGFFGKGSLSRSEATWYTRTCRALGLKVDQPLSSEEITNARRQERKKFKEERARTEQLEFDRRKLIDQGIEVVVEKEEMLGGNDSLNTATEVTGTLDSGPEKGLDGAGSLGIISDPLVASELIQDGQLVQHEYLQLMPCEALFLQDLGSLEIVDDDSGSKIDQVQLFSRFDLNPVDAPDNQLLLEYIAYHHYRSHGWCVRSGVKFGVNMMLYRRGPPFSHAEFAVMIMPCYADESKNKQLAKEWWWSASVGRVIGSVKKTIVFCYIVIPDSIEWSTGQDLQSLLSQYFIREVVYRRWLPIRNRD